MPVGVVDDAQTEMSLSNHGIGKFFKAPTPPASGVANSIATGWLDVHVAERLDDEVVRRLWWRVPG